MNGGVCIGVDVGGTFTDAVLDDGREMWRAKVPTTPDDVGRGVIDVCRAVAAAAGRALPDVLRETQRFGLGTTAVTNLLATRTGRRVGLLTTRGFEDLVPIARGALASDGGWLTPPPQIVERGCIAGVDERIDRDGTVLRPLDPAEVLEIGTRLVERERVEALAVSFLWSFRNPAHEAEAVAVLEEAFPGVPVTSGAALHPAIREHERTMAALLNAYVAGALDAVGAVATELAGLGLAVPVLLVHSNGGTTTLAEATRMPAALVGSGPAAGVAAAAALLPEGALVACDMGGTSLDIALVRDGSPSRSPRGPLMGFWAALSRVEIASIGAGGGSIAWVDARGMLRVGPASAGAHPGPACYGKGGRDATLTDALVVLGYVDPDGFLDGRLLLDAAAAWDMCAALGARLGLDAVPAAWGIRRVMLAGMTKAVRRELATRGLDPRTHTLVGYGGCAGLFACDLARALGAPRVLVPRTASVLSARGAASADVRRERVHSIAALVPVPAETLSEVARELAESVIADLAADCVAPDDREVTLEVDLRFKRQTCELTVALDEVDDRVNERLVDAFRARYAARYGEAAMMRGAPIELVTVRAVGIGRAPFSPATAPARAASPVDGGARRRRLCVGRDAADVMDVPVVTGPELVPGAETCGPLLVDQGDTGIWLPPATTARVRSDGALLVEVGP